MPDIYTAEWYECVKEAINAKVVTLKSVPDQSFLVRVEIAGDGASPYVGEGDERHFLVQLADGLCAWYREVAKGEEEDGLNYRFTGPARVFDEIAAGLTDPIDAALQGTIKARGDMRFLMRQADLVNTLLEAYTSGVETTWPQGRPPYAPVEREAAHA